MPVSATNCTITLQLQSGSLPTFNAGSSNDGRVSESYASTSDGSNQYASNPPDTPTLKIYSGATNVVQWTLDRNTDLRTDWRYNTDIIGIVLENGENEVVNSPGGAGFGLALGASASYASAQWAGPAGSSGIGNTQYSPYLLLFPAASITESLNVTASQFFSGSTPLHPKKNDPNNAGQQINVGYSYFPIGYRIYFYTPSVGVWWKDPEVDMYPKTG